MPYDQVPAKWKAGKLHSGGPKGPVVKSQKQAVAIMLSEKRKAGSNPEYSKGTSLVTGIKPVAPIGGNKKIPLPKKVEVPYLPLHPTHSRYYQKGTSNVMSQHMAHKNRNVMKCQ